MLFRSAYFGLAFDVLLKGIENKPFAEWDHIIFAGFNALTAAEEKLLKFLLDAGKAEIYWDADDYYLSDPRQEAGRFLRQYANKNTFGPINWIENSLQTSEKTVRVIGVPGNVGQAKLAGELLHELIRKKGTADGIALVLVDEGLLLPVLNSIPPETGDFNVTMGFPLKQTPVFSLINIVLSMFANAKRFAHMANEFQPLPVSALRFYYKDIQRFLSHPFIVLARKNNGLFGAAEVNTQVVRSFYAPEELLLLISSHDRPLAAVFEAFTGKILIESGDVISLVRNIISFLHDTFALNEIGRAHV